ncbi:MAG: hypothetical protein NXI15_15700 [Gammaproteobacteria bacterium]|jgi:hypothetical protein|nr:hypothetical protein [Gammaproteobacteria bacterium]
MADVLQFPSPQAQGFAYLERELRRLLHSKGADDALVAYAIDQLTHIYRNVSEAEKQHFNVPLPPGLTPAQRKQLEKDINSGVNQLLQHNHRLTLELVAQLLLTRVRLFQLERQD